MKTGFAKSTALLIVIVLTQFSTFGQDNWPKLITSETDTLVVNTIENVRKQTKYNEVCKERISQRDTTIKLLEREIELKDTVIQVKDSIIANKEFRESKYEEIIELKEQEVEVLEELNAIENKKFRKARRWAFGMGLLNAIFIVFISTNG